MPDKSKDKGKQPLLIPLKMATDMQQVARRTYSEPPGSPNTDPPPSADNVFAPRRLQKTSSLGYKLSRRWSKDSTSSSARSEESGGARLIDEPTIVKYGSLQPDVQRFKNRTGYLIMTSTVLVKFSSAEAARACFPQLGPNDSRRQSSVSSPISSGQGKEAIATDKRIEIPLERIVALFNEEGSSPNFGIEIWWLDPIPAVSSSNAQVFFGLPRERDDWMTEIRRAIKSRRRFQPEKLIVPANVNSYIRNAILGPGLDARQQRLDVFPIVRRSAKTPQPSKDEFTDDPKNGETFFMAIGAEICGLYRFEKTTTKSWGPGLGKVRCKIFGVVSLRRVRATMVPREERFVLSFRLPCQDELRMELASRFYKEILAGLLRADRFVKPVWPQQLQREIFDIKGGMSPLHIPAGADLGGLKRTLAAYCAAFGVDPPEWMINWKTNKELQPEFRLLPPSSGTEPYSCLQLLAVLRALRFNDFFKSLCFRDVSFARIWGVYDLPKYTESIAVVSRTGILISSDHKEILRNSSLLFQEIHAVVFTSGSIRAIDLTNVLASKVTFIEEAKSRGDAAPYRNIESQLLRPILLLVKNQLCLCSTIKVGGNPLTGIDTDELVSTLTSPHSSIKYLGLSNCGIPSESLKPILEATSLQAHKLEGVDISRNPCHLAPNNFIVFLQKLEVLKSINLAYTSAFGNVLQYLGLHKMERWSLEELDLSGIKLHIESVQVLACYLRSPKSSGLRRLYLGDCGLTGRAIAMLFQAMGPGRKMAVSINGGSAFQGYIEDLCSAVERNFGPEALFMENCQFSRENNFVKLLRAFTESTTIRLLSLAGISLPVPITPNGSLTLRHLFERNKSIRYLDLSGSSSKLEDNHLGQQITFALADLAANNTLLHLRIRDQQLHRNVTDMAQGVAKNRTLRTLDISGNNFSISEYSYMVRNFLENETIQEIKVFDKGEHEAAIQRSFGPKPQSSVRSMFSRRASTRSPRVETIDDYNTRAAELKQQWYRTRTTLLSHLEMNRQRFQEDGDRHASEPYTLSTEGSGEETFSELFGGLAVVDKANRHAASEERNIHLDPRFSASSPTLGHGSWKPRETGTGPERHTKSPGASSEHSATVPGLESPEDTGYGDRGFTSPETVPHTPADSLPPQNERTGGELLQYMRETFWSKRAKEDAEYDAGEEADKESA